MNFLCGLPRSGSTLLCNVLNQNPVVYASSTSPMINVITGMSFNYSNSPEIKGQLDETMTERIRNTARAVLGSWYNDKHIVFDKSRAWSNNALMLKDLYPKALIICTVRDLRNVFASVEKQHRKNAILDEATDLTQKSIYNRADAMFSPTGLIGSCIMGIEDMVRRNIPNVIYVGYENFCQNPKLVMDRIYSAVESDGIIEPFFDHDFNNVVNVATDPDGLYLNKYPHKGEGKIIETDPNEWQKYISPDVAELIQTKFATFNKTFGYI